MNGTLGLVVNIGLGELDDPMMYCLLLLVVQQPVLACGHCI
jgi:hypothetical protein